ncbi:hypothetical protein [Thermococcus sp.]
MARRNASPQDIKNALELLAHLHREHGDKIGPVFQSSRAVESFVDMLKSGDLKKVVEDIKTHQGVDISRILEEDDIFASKLHLHEILLKNYSVPVPAGWADVLKKLAKGQLSKEEAARILALHTILKRHYSEIERLENELRDSSNPEALLRQRI